MKHIGIFCLFVVGFLINIYGEEKMKSVDGWSEIYNVAGWIINFQQEKMRMPESLDELFEKNPQYRNSFEISKKSGFIISYTYIDINSMIVRIQHGEDIFECQNKLNIYYYYQNGSLIYEYNIDTYKNLPPPVPSILLQIKE